jgi:mRNA interferase HigB
VTLTGTDKIEAFGATHSDAKSALERWTGLIRSNRFRNVLELRKTFGPVDPVEDHPVFNIRGNNYRLIAVVDYEDQICVVHRVMTHKEYDKWSPL